MEKPKVGKFEKLVVGSTYRLLQRLNPFTYYYDPKITKETKECSDKNHILFDGHFHDFFSDGDSSPEHMADVSYRRGIKIISGSNHKTLEHWEYYKEVEKKYSDLVYIPGIEISAKEGDLVAWFPNYRCKEFKIVKDLTSEKKLSAKEAIAKVHKAGGVVIAPHPNKYRGIGLRNVYLLKERLDGVEEINAEAGENNSLGKKLGLPSFGNSDAHSKINVGSAFSKLPKEYFKDCFDETGKIIDKDKFRRKVIDLVKDEKVIIRGMQEPSRITPCLAVKSSFEENIAKTTYANPFSLWLKGIEYSFDKIKAVAKRLTACLEKE
jgi:predicted metal-dependent phosphoesterase TrpH